MQHRRSRTLATLSETFWVLVLALVVLFAFFVALGAFSPGDVLGLTLVVALLAVLWVAHAVWDVAPPRPARPGDRPRTRAPRLLDHSDRHCNKLRRPMTDRLPNILYLHSHDTGRYVQPYGHQVPTPNIQRLADQGMLFREAFCAAPTCSGSRACAAHRTVDAQQRDDRAGPPRLDAQRLLAPHPAHAARCGLLVRADRRAAPVGGPRHARLRPRGRHRHHARRDGRARRRQAAEGPAAAAVLPVGRLLRDAPRVLPGRPRSATACTRCRPAICPTRPRRARTWRPTRRARGRSTRVSAPCSTRSTSTTSPTTPWSSSRPTTGWRSPAPRRR